MTTPIDDSHLKRPMEKLLAQQGIGWIKLTDRKPDDGSLCIVYAQSCDPQMPFISLSRYDKEMGFHWLVGIWAKAITHWIEAPQPPTTQRLII